LSQAEAVFKEFIEKQGFQRRGLILGLLLCLLIMLLNVGMLGMETMFNILTNECDVLIALGMRFDDRVAINETYAKQAKVIHL
jgi:acetolactate synthase-1/2/3 large subunit